MKPEEILGVLGLCFQIVTIVCLFRSFKRIKDLEEQSKKDHYTLEHLSIKQDKANKEIIEALKKDFLLCFRHKKSRKTFLRISCSVILL